jgi:acyl carrier protein
VTEQEVFEKLCRLIQNVLGVKSEEVTREKTLVGDLGAESIDLLDLSFLIEDTFAITIAPNEFETEVKKVLPGGVFERDGFLTPEAVEELRKRLPQVDQTRLKPGLRKAELPSLLTVDVFVKLIHGKVVAGGTPDA